MLHKKTLGFFWRILKGILIKSSGLNLENTGKNHRNEAHSKKQSSEINTKFTVNSQYVSKGFSLTEILVAVGIMATLSGIGAISYLNYLNKGRLMTLAQSANQFFKAADICVMLRGDHEYDLSKCSTKAKLKFRCDDCSAITYYPGQSKSPRIPGRLDIEFKSGDCSMCVTYSPSDQSSSYGAKHTTIKCYDWKFCTLTQTYGKTWEWSSKTGWSKYTGSPVTNTGYGARRPFQKCSADSDCKSGEVCYGFPHGGLNNNQSFGGKGVCN